MREHEIVVFPVSCGTISFLKSTSLARRGLMAHRGDAVRLPRPYNHGIVSVGALATNSECRNLLNVHETLFPSQILRSSQPHCQ